MVAKLILGPKRRPQDISERVQDAIEDLLGDAQRLGGTLERSSIDNYYLDRKIRPQEASAVERAIKDAGVAILEEPPPAAATFAPGAGDALEALLRTIRTSTEWLNEDEEKACGHAIRRHLEYSSSEDQDPELLKRLESASMAARERLVVSNVFRALKIAREHRKGSGLSLEDRVQEGVVGLMRAAEKFDPSLETRFATYAHYWIRQSIERAAADKGATIRIPVHRRSQMSQYRRARRAVGIEGAYRPSEIPIIAEKLGWTNDFTHMIAMLLEMRTNSLDLPLTEDGSAKIADVIPSEEPNPEDAVLANDFRRIVHALVASLRDARQRDILARRFGLNDLGEGQTLEEIGQIYGVTRERIRQIEAKALKKLLIKAKNQKLHRLLEDRT
ncbi:MAG: sigma-70 family RNA polymerase sigma factor [Paracoccaceae bacterium]